MNTDYGVYPQEHELIQDGEQGTVTVRNRYYCLTHSLAQGGAITEVRYFHGRDCNLLLSPCATEVAFAGGGVCSDLHDGQAKLTVQHQGEDLLLVFEGVLRDAEGHESGVAYRHSYLHSWGYVRIDKQLRFTQPRRVSRLCVHSFSLRPELSWYGVRPGAPAEVATWTGAFGNCQWGRFTPGAAFDCAYQSRYVPRYVCCAEPGREGLEFFLGSDLSQWDYQVAGRPGHGSLHLGPQTRPPGVGLSVCPLDIPRGGVVLQGEYSFRYFLGVPIISGRANRLFIHKSFQRKNWPTKELLHQYADSGVTSLHFHHDGDSHRDGQFWRDGSYPPFGPEDMAEYDRVIRQAHDCGLRVATYFSNKELHPTVQAYQEHGAQWARLPDQTGEQLHNAYSGDEFGAQMCLRSGWLEFHKAYIDKVLSHHPLDGTYYDWNVALYCHNSHQAEAAAPASPGGEQPWGDWAHSPAGHWDMEELLELVAWTRRRVGPEGLMIIHNTIVPMAALENYADSIVAMEWGYSRLAIGAPPLEELPLEWSFMGHRSRGVIGYGCLEEDAPERVHRQMTVRSVLTGSPPWPADDLATAMFAALSHRDLREMQFEDARWAPVRLNAEEARAALYHRPEQALLVVGNMAAEARLVGCGLDLARTRLAAAAEYLVRIGETETRLSAADLQSDGVRVTVEGDGVAVAEITPLA